MQLMEHALLPWTRTSHAFIRALAARVTGKAKLEDTNTVCLALNILDLLVNSNS